MGAPGHFCIISPRQQTVLHRSRRSGASGDKSDSGTSSAESRRKGGVDGQTPPFGYLSRTGETPSHLQSRVLESPPVSDFEEVGFMGPASGTCPVPTVTRVIYTVGG